MRWSNVVDNSDSSLLISLLISLPRERGGRGKTGSLRVVIYPFVGTEKTKRGLGSGGS